jgi:predicted ATPase
MIRRLAITGFKRFESQSLDFKPLTVLAGRNGAGKTSTIHALLLTHHAMERNDGIVELNGPYDLELGWFESLVNAQAEDNQFSVEIDGDSGEAAKWNFLPGSTEQHATAVGPGVGVWDLQKEKRSFQYLAAERNGPRITQSTSALPVEMLSVGCRGQFVAQVLDKLGSTAVAASRLAPDSDVPALVKAQTEAWLSRITRPIEIDTATFVGTEVASLSFRDPGGTWVRPTNMGFGISYALPIVLAALTAPSGGLLIIENPEAHLHPAGQSEAGMFLATMAAAGVQVLVETHSDHVLNGIRRAIGEGQVLKAEDATVHFFADSESPVQSLAFTPTGGISEWPRGFLDQYQLDVAKISRIRRPR